MARAGLLPGFIEIPSTPGCRLAAGKKMLEAKPQLKHGEFGPWIKRNFNITERHAQFYVSLAIATRGDEKRSADRFSSLRDFLRWTGGGIWRRIVSGHRRRPDRPDRTTLGSEQ
jgi:hypothetical protein